MPIRRLRLPIFGAPVVILAVALLFRVPTPAQPARGQLHHHHNPAIIRERHATSATSTNWSGYAVTGANGSVTDVKGSWVVPSLNCAMTPNAYSDYWVGIDGYSSNTVEQIGIEADCSGGTASYFAWFEFYPHWPITINSVAVQPGDTISAAVSYGAKGTFTLTLHNDTEGVGFSTSSKMPQAELSSAEWIVEAPSTSSGVLPLADFVPVSFTSCEATVGKAGGLPIGSFSPNVQINMETSSSVPKATTSALTPDGLGFTVAFLSPGP